MIWYDNLTRTPMFEVLARLNRERATGTLVVTDGAMATTEIQFVHGAPASIAPRSPDDTVEALLFRAGRLSIDALDSAPDAVADPFDRERADAGREQARRVLIDLAREARGTFVFVPGEPPAEPAELGLDVRALLATGTRLMPLDVIRRGAGGPLDRIAPMQSGPAAASAPHSPEAGLVLGALCGEAAEGDHRSWPTDFEVLCAVWELRLLGLVRVAVGSEGLSIGSLLLGIRKDVRATSERDAAPPAEHVDTARDTPCPADVERRPPVLLFGEIGAVTLHSGLAADADSDTDSEPTAPPQARRAPVAAEVRVRALDPSELSDPAGSARVTATSAAEWFQTGERFLRELDFHNAVTSFRQAVELAPDCAEYRMRLGAALARNRNWRKEAETHLLRATLLKPWDVKPQLALAKLYAESRLTKRAIARYRAALAIDPDCALARRELDQLAPFAADDAQSHRERPSLTRLEPDPNAPDPAMDLENASRGV